MLIAALAYLRVLPNAPAGSRYWTTGYGLDVLRLVFFLLAGRLDPTFVTSVAERLQKPEDLPQPLSTRAV